MPLMMWVCWENSSAMIWLYARSRCLQDFTPCRKVVDAPKRFQRGKEIIEAFYFRMRDSIHPLATSFAIIKH